MNKLLTLSYYFSARPDPQFNFTTLTVVVAALMVAAAVAIKILRRKKVKDEVLRKMLKRFPGALITFAVALLILLFFRETGVPLLSMRIWWVLYAIFFIGWLLKATLSFGKEYRERSEKARHRSVQSKYLPNQKR